MKILRCTKCNAKMFVIDECKCESCEGITCCNEKMIETTINTEEASFEKHMPQYQIMDNKIEVVVPHPMDEDHYIELIALVHDNETEMVELKPGMEAKKIFNYYPNSIIYSLCNKHGLWKNEVK